MCLILLEMAADALSGNERNPVYGGQLLGCADNPSGCRPGGALRRSVRRTRQTSGMNAGVSLVKASAPAPGPLRFPDTATVAALAGMPIADAATLRAVLERAGCPVESARDGDGLVWRGDDDLDMAAIAREVGAHGLVCTLDHVAITDSTNARLLDAAASGGGAPQALFAELQTAGRGRRGRRWVGRYGDALMFSLLVAAGRSLRELPGLPLAAGVALATALEDIGVRGIGLKWPNDVMLDGAKLAGVLVEAVPARPGLAVIGVGLNWRPPPPDEIEADRPVAGLQPAFVDGSPDRSQMAGHLLVALLRAVERFRDDGLAPVIAAFARHDVLAGTAIDVLVEGERRRGVALGLAADGALRVRHGAAEHRYHSAEVSVRPA